MTYIYFFNECDIVFAAAALQSQVGCFNFLRKAQDKFFLKGAAAKMSSTAIVDAIERVRSRMQELHLLYEQPDAAVVALRDEVKGLLKKEGLMERSFINSKWMGTHPDNRYGDGVVPADVIALIGDIFGQGFSLLALQDPTCSEMPPPGHARYARLQHFNVHLAEGSGGMLPLYEDVIKAVSVTCGHTSQGFRCFQGGVPCDDPRFTQDGKLSIRRLQETQPSYAKAVSEGIEWDMLRYQAEDAFPWVPKLFQESGNAGQQIAHCESRLEIMLKIREIAARNSRLHNGNPFWDRVKTEAIRAGSSFKNEIEGLVDCVSDLSGGLDNPVLLYEYRNFVRQLQVQRVVRGWVLGACAKAKIGVEGACPLFRVACMKAMSSASSKYSRGDEQTLLKSSDFQQMASTDKKRDQIYKCEAFLKETRVVSEPLDITESIRATMIGLVDVQAVHFVMNKPDPARGSFKSLSEIGHKFCQDLSNLLQKPIPSPWAAAAPAPKAAAIMKAPKVFTASGEWSNAEATLRAKFEVGTQVRHLDSKVTYHIQNIAKDHIVLKDAAGVETSHAHDVFLEGKYNVFTDDKDLSHECV